MAWNDFKVRMYHEGTHRCKSAYEEIMRKQRELPRLEDHIKRIRIEHGLEKE